jgi:hypothetical protein
MAALLLLFLAAFFWQPSGAKAETAPYFTFSLDRASASAGDLVRVRVQARASADPAAGFRARVFYDSDALTFSGTESSSKIQSGTLETNSSSDPVCCVYVCNTDKSSAPSLSGNVLTFVFQVRSGAEPGQSTVTADIDQICGYSGEILGSDCGETMQFQIESGSSSRAELSDLDPSSGRLSPDFSPDILDYEMRVASSVESVTFDADAVGGGRVKISRKSLHAAGSDTVITITVTSEDGSSKTDYRVTVHREEAPPPSSKAGIRPVASSGSAGSGRTGKSSSARTESAVGTVSPGRKNVSSGPASGSAVASRAESVESMKQDAVPVAGFSVAQAQAPASESTVRVVLVQNQMPSFFTGMLAAVLCAVAGIALSLWLSPGRAKRP